MKRTIGEAADHQIPSRKERAGALAAMGSVGAAALSSACCWLPLMLLAFGASTAGVGVLFERWRPYFAVAAFALLGLGFYFACFRAGACANEEDGCACRSRRRLRFRRAMLWASAGFVLVFVTFPRYVGAIYTLLDGAPSAQTVKAESTARAEPTRTLFYRVEGMTCQACAAGLQAGLSRLPGVRSAEVDFESKTATIRAAAQSIEPAAADAARKLGFSLTPTPAAPPTSDLKKGQTP